jgi:aldehyde:ferredoxin oxidoreductase
MNSERRIYGYNGRILKVDLSSEDISIEENDAGFYRTYPGGGLLGIYYMLKEMQRGVDPLSEKNVLVFAPSVVTGSAVTGVSRFSVSAKSPLTGAAGDSQCGGGWGPRLKHAGFDAVVIRGRASRPVYLSIDNGRAELRDATRLWGTVTGDAQSLIQEELGNRVEVAQIGPAGENLVKHACITAGLSHFAGRTGMGAVMGSKLLKAIAVQGRRPYAFFEEDGIRSVARKGADRFKESEVHQSFHAFGTALGVDWNREIDNIITNNFQSGHFDRVEEIRGQRLAETILKETDTCWGCTVRCKRVVELESPYRIDPRYGGPEFETITTLGSNLGIHDLAFIAKASEMCNSLGMDTISTGGMISFAMECFERGIIGERETSGLRLKFGGKEEVLKLIEMIAHRKGVGEILADGPGRAVLEWGEESRPLAMAVKNQIIPAHMPQIKQSQALMYAVNPFGADHMSSEHDWLATADGDVARGLGITDFTSYETLDTAKVRATMLSQLYYSMLDTLTLCMFCWNPGSLYDYHDIEEFVHATTGWRATFWELMRTGERRVNMMRAYNAGEGFNRTHDTLPERCFEPLPDGVSAGKMVDRDAFEDRLTEYYAMMHWNTESGNPTRESLVDLGVGWVWDKIR